MFAKLVTKGAETRKVSSDFIFSLIAKAERLDKNIMNQSGLKEIGQIN